MKYILIYFYTDVYEKAECEFYLTRYEVPKQEVLVSDNKEFLNSKLLELNNKHYRNFTYSIYEGILISGKFFS